MSTRYPGTDFKPFIRRVVFSYEYLDSFVKFDDQEVPLRKEFFSTLRGEECFANDYDYAQKVWTAFGCVLLEDYYKLYLASDVC